MEDNEASRDQVDQRQTRGMPNKSKICLDSTSTRQDYRSHKEESRENTPISPLRMPDLPLPTPPPMANIMMTSRIGYRRILGRSTEFRSSILGNRSHSMDFGFRDQNVYGVDGRRGTLDRAVDSVANLGSRRQELADRNFEINNKPENMDHWKSQQHDCMRSQTLDSRRQVFRENRANTVEFMSPILTRAYLYHREGSGESYGDRTKMGVINRHQATLTDQLGLSPLPRHKNIENLSERLEDFNDYSTCQQHIKYSENKEKTRQISEEPRSKYFSRESVLSNELEEVRTLNSELQRRYIGESTEENINRLLKSGSNSETSPEYYSVFFNEHYISDIDENEEIKEFICGYKTPERRYSDQSERSLQKSASAKNISDYYPQFQTTTLPSSFKTSSVKKCSKRTKKNPSPNTSAFVVHSSKQSALKSTSNTLGPSLRISSASIDNLRVKRSNKKSEARTSDFARLKNTAISKSSEPISIPSGHRHNSRRLSQGIATFSNSSATLPISSAHSHQSSSVSSFKSSDYYSFVPLVTSSVKKVEFSGDSTGKVIKSPQRTVVKLAKIR